jgi:predicted dinucleotide-binding enzyme
MDIGIIGAGNIGAALARRLTALGHRVHLANSRGPASLAAVAAATGAQAVTVEQAAQARDVVIVTIPEKNILQLPAGLFDATPPTVAIVDTGNYYPRERDGCIDAIEDGATESRWVSQQIGRSVIKAFNNIAAAHLLSAAKPAGVPGRVALPVAGDVAKAKAVVMQLIDALGFDPIDAGSLDDSWRQQPGSPVYGTDLDAEGVRNALAEARRVRTPEWSARG